MSKNKVQDIQVQITNSMETIKLIMQVLDPNNFGIFRWRYVTEIYYL